MSVLRVTSHLITFAAVFIGCRFVSLWVAPIVFAVVIANAMYAAAEEECRR